MFDILDIYYIIHAILVIQQHTKIPIYTHSIIHFPDILNWNFQIHPLVSNHFPLPYIPPYTLTLSLDWSPDTHSRRIPVQSPSPL